MSLEVILERIALAGWDFHLGTNGFADIRYTFAFWPRNTNPAYTVQQGFEGKTPILALMAAKKDGNWNLEEVKRLQYQDPVYKQK